jgi:hypothetical protein
MSVALPGFPRDLVVVLTEQLIRTADADNVRLVAQCAKAQRPLSPVSLREYAAVRVRYPVAFRAENALPGQDSGFDATQIAPCAANHLACRLCRDL